MRFFDGQTGRAAALDGFKSYQLSWRDDLDQFEMQRDEFEIVMQVEVRQATHMALPEFFGAGK